MGGVGTRICGGKAGPSGSLQPAAKLPKHIIGLGVVGGGLNVRNVAEAAQSGKAARTAEAYWGL
jgi:phosphoribosylanthranilate isomerase